jgi:hypothetical protein
VLGVQPKTVQQKRIREVHGQTDRGGVFVALHNRVERLAPEPAAKPVDASRLLHRVERHFRRRAKHPLLQDGPFLDQTFAEERDRAHIVERLRLNP